MITARARPLKMLQVDEWMLLSAMRKIEISITAMVAANSTILGLSKYS